LGNRKSEWILRLRRGNKKCIKHTRKITWNYLNLFKNYLRKVEILLKRALRSFKIIDNKDLSRIPSSHNCFNNLPWRGSRH
jgi:hypothetical protein